MYHSFYDLLADGMLIVHFVVIAFIVLGQACVVAGYFRTWRWVRNFPFRVCHLLAICIVVLQAWTNRLCPLTLWENMLRQKSGQQPYATSFIEYWVGKIVFYDAPQWSFILVYTLFGAVVAASWVWVRPGSE